MGIPPQGNLLLGDKQGHRPLGMEQQPAAGQWGRGPGLEVAGTAAGLGGTPAPGDSKAAAAAAQGTAELRRRVEALGKRKTLLLD